MRLESLYLEFERLIGRDLTEWERRMISFSWVNGFAQGVVDVKGIMDGDLSER